MDESEIKSLYERVEERSGRFKASTVPKNDRPYASLFGLSRNEYNSLKEAQNGKCFLCKRTGRKLVLDHNHRTGKARKFLCNSCNSRLGLIEGGFLSFLTLDELLDYMDLGT